MTTDRWLRVVIAVACAVAAVVSLAAALTEGTPELTSDDAREFTEEALQSAGFRSVEVVGKPERKEYQRPDKPDEERVPVWETRAEVRSGRRSHNVRLAIHREEGRAVSLDEGRGRFFTDEQFKRLDDYSSTEAVDRQQRRNTAGVAAAVLLILVAGWLALVNR